MMLSAKRSALSVFFPLGWTVVYELMELDEKTLAGLTPQSELQVGGAKKKLHERGSMAG